MSALASFHCNPYKYTNILFHEFLSIRYVTDFLLCSLQIGFCCVYVVFISHNIQFAVGALDVRIWMLIILPFLIVPSLVSNIRTLAYFTTIGNVIVLVGLGIIYQYLFTHVQSPARLPATNGALNACVAFGQIVYAFEGIAVVSFSCFHFLS